MSNHTCSAWLADQGSSKNLDCPACREQDSIECSCPNWWFPPDVKERARKLSHGFGGVVAHHATCAKVGH